MKKVLVLLLCIILVSCEGTTQVLHLSKSAGGLYSTTCELNGSVRAEFFIDTGCSTTTISEREAFVLLMNGSLTEDDFVAWGRYILADGSIMETPTVRLKTFKVGDTVLHNVEVSINKSVTLLGQNVLSRLCKISIDYEQNTLNYEQN